MKRTFNDPETGMGTTKETLSSVNISVSTKGTYTWDVKIYLDENEDGAFDKAVGELKRVDGLLKQQFGSQGNG